MRPLALLRVLLRLGRERLRNEARDEPPDRALRHARVHPGLAGLCAAVAEAGGTGEPEAVALLQRREKRAAGVALAGVRAALLVPRAQHGLGIEAAVVGDRAEAAGVRLRAVRVRRDRDPGVAHPRGRGRRALRGRPEAGDRGEHARSPQRALAHRSDVHRRDPRAPVELQEGDVVAGPVRDYVVAVDYYLRDRVLLTASSVRV